MLYGFAYGVKRTKRRSTFPGQGGAGGAGVGGRGLGVGAGRGWGVGGEGKEGFLNEMPLKVNSEGVFSQVRGRGNERGICIRQFMKS